MGRQGFAILLIVGIISMPGAIMTANAQEFTPNYDESKVPDYELPDPLKLLDGGTVEDVQTWERKRRPEILSLFENHVYGKTPERSFPLDYDSETGTHALNGKAVRKQVTLYPFGREKGCNATLLIYLPKDAPRPVPVFLALNFRGNHSIEPDPEIAITENMVRIARETAKAAGRETPDLETTRGAASSRWPAETIVERGYALATMWYYEIDPDYDDGFQNGIHPFFYEEGQERPRPDGWGSIGAWAWGLSRIMDYFEEDAEIDADHVALLGHSRLGKTSLWAGAQDPRFAIVISNDSGCGGAALSRRAYGETVGRINRVFPHWFCDNFNQYNENEAELPVDQHMLIALMAPRPVYVASAVEDRWADPKGEFLSAKNAEPVYELYGLKGLGVDEWPAVNEPVGDRIGYHVREGKHDVTDYDWARYLDFADRHWNR